MAIKYKTGPIDVEGCVVDDFRLTNHLPPAEAPAVIERDRLIMSARPGFNRKLLPLCIEEETACIYSGGQYLFDTHENALAFGNWCRNEFEIDGVLILDRPDFADVSAQVYRVIGAHDFKDIHSAQIACRTEIWSTDGKGIEDKLINMWPSLRDRAGQEEKSSLWLLHNAEEGEVGLVTVIDRLGEHSQSELDYATLNSAMTADSYGDGWSWGSKTFDRSHWVFTIWFPNTKDARAMPPLWPNSSPLPAPLHVMEKTSVA